jgi:hypothetical protein
MKEEQIKVPKDEQIEETVGKLMDELFTVTRTAPDGGYESCTEKIKNAKYTYCLFCHKPKKKKWWVFGKKVCKTSTCPLRDGYTHPLAPQDRGESLDKMERNPNSPKPAPENMVKILGADKDTIKAYDSVETDNMPDLMLDETWVKKYKIKDEG